MKKKYFTQRSRSLRALQDNPFAEYLRGVFSNLCDLFASLCLRALCVRLPSAFLQNPLLELMAGLPSLNLILCFRHGSAYRCVFFLMCFCTISPIFGITLPKDLEQVGDEVDPATKLPLVVRTKQTGHELRLVPGGTVLIGSNEGDLDEKPVRGISKYPFYLAKHTVSNSQYEKFKPDHEFQRGKYAMDPNHPATNVSWYDAVNYIQYVAEEEGKAAGKDLKGLYAMPTEAAAEKAAQGATSPRRYPWGDSITDTDKRRYSSRSALGVDEGSPNDLGFYHMTANVFYWCYDWYDSDYYKDLPLSNPLGAVTGRTKSLRGGTWYIYNKSFRCADRWNNFPETLSDFIGIRLGRYVNDMVP